MTEVTSHDHEASLISPTTEAVAAWQLPKKCQKKHLIYFLQIITVFYGFVSYTFICYIITCSLIQFCVLPYFFHILHATACSQFGFPDKLDQLSIAGYFDFFFVYVISSFNYH